MYPDGKSAMRLTTKGRFAVTAMIDLGLRQHGGPVTLAAISQRQKISLSYLEQLFARMRRAGLVSGVRGPGGGYRLARSADSVTIALRKKYIPMATMAGSASGTVTRQNVR